MLTWEKLKDVSALTDEEIPEACKVFAHLYEYAQLKQLAIMARTAGDIESALILEAHADVYFNFLPENLKW